MLKLHSCSIWAHLCWTAPTNSCKGNQKHRDPHTHNSGVAAVSGSAVQSGITAAYGGGAEASSKAVAGSGTDVSNHSAAASVEAEELSEDVSQPAQVSKNISLDADVQQHYDLLSYLDLSDGLCLLAS